MVFSDTVNDSGIIRNTNGRFIKGHKDIANNKGRIQPLELRKRWSDIKKGKKQSLETKIKRGIYRKGKNAPAWRGGTSTDIDLLRGSKELRLWRESVFIRDNYTDQDTKVKGGKLQAHHILNFSDHPELRFAIDNGITLSEKSHIEFHKKYGKRNNTKEQLEEFLNK